MAVTDLGKTSLKLGGVSQILITPMERGADDAWTKSATTYSLDDIVADSTSITQEDNTVNAIDSETKDEPIFENITLGRYTFTCNSGDIQGDLLTNVMGYKMSTDKSMIYAPSTYSELFAEVEIKFVQGGSIICPKVKISGRIDASSLKTGMVQGVISGTCYTETVGTSPNTIQTPFYIKKAAAAG